MKDRKLVEFIKKHADTTVQTTGTHENRKIEDAVEYIHEQ